MSRRLYSILYRQGRVVEKLLRLRLTASFVRRFFVLMKANRYDLVVIHRRILPVWLPFARYLLRRIRKPIVYDFDDAVFLTDNRGGVLEEVSSLLGQSKQVAEILRCSSAVIAGNEALEAYALSFNSNVHVLPTPVDSETYRSEEEAESRDGLAIGWIGSHTTSQYLNFLDDAFRRLLEKYPNLEIHVMGGSYELRGYEDRVRNIPWRLEDEYKVLQTFDVGVMPLKDDVWERYKCGFKALLYMSMNIPVVCSPVGVNKKIVDDGLSGFLAKTTEEWFDKISILLEDSDLRRRVGREGRKTVEAHYSVLGNEEGFYSILQSASAQPLRKDTERILKLQRRTQRSLDFKWTQFPNLAPANEGHFLNYMHPLSPEFFQGKVGLDATCGYGRHLYFPSAYGAERVVGMDLSNLVFSARQTLQDRPNISLVKGDVFRMPFKSDFFDFIYSVGALHHLPEPERSFQSLLQHTKPGGSVIIWVYSKNRRLMTRVVEAFRFVTLRLPFFTLKKLSFLCACVDYSIFVLLFFLLPIKVLRRIPIVERVGQRVKPRIRLYDRYPFWANYADWFDRLSSPVRTYFDRADLERWSRRADLVNVEISPTDNYGWRLYGERSKASSREPTGQKVAAG
jgi:glycosyltransferase involved in cell wall biosynthesis